MSIVPTTDRASPARPPSRAAVTTASSASLTLRRFADAARPRSQSRLSRSNVTEIGSLGIKIRYIVHADRATILEAGVLMSRLFRVSLVSAVLCAAGLLSAEQGAVF